MAGEPSLFLVYQTSTPMSTTTVHGMGHRRSQTRRRSRQA